MSTIITAEQMDALPDDSLVCTAGGIVFQKYDNWFKEGEHGWQRPGREWTERTRNFADSLHHPITLIPWTPPE